MSEFWAMLLLVLVATASEAHGYTAGVLEHVLYESRSVQDNYRLNLDRYWEAAQVASRKGVDLMVFPEIGLQSMTVPKEDYDVVPEVNSNPCLEGNQSGIVAELSCMARNTSMVIVVNAYLRFGSLAHNTNLVFARNGTVLARYFKIHLFLEENSVDPPKEKKIVTFETDFGKFGTFICFDVLFEEAAKLMESYPIEAVVFTYTWNDNLPMNNIVQMQASMAHRFNKTIIGSGIHHPYFTKLGSGIFNGRDSHAVTWEQDGKSRLLIAKIENGILKSNESIVLKDYTNDPSFTKYRHYNLDYSNYTMVRLNKSSDDLKACNNGLCCFLKYRSPKLEGTFYLGVFKGTRSIIKRYFVYEENCFIAECKGDSQCETFVTEGSTTFSELSLQGSFSTPHVYPSLTTSSLAPVPPRLWNYQLGSGSGIFSHNLSQPIISAVLYGRKYELDGPPRSS